MVKDKTKKAVEEVEETTLEFEEVEALPPSTRRGATGKYSKLVSEIAKQPKKGTFKIKIDKQNLPLKSIYPSLEKSLQRLAKLNGVDFSEAQTETVSTAKGKRLYHRYPKFREWKKKNLHIQVQNKELYLVKVTDKVLETE